MHPCYPIIFTDISILSLVRVLWRWLILQHFNFAFVIVISLSIANTCNSKCRAFYERKQLLSSKTVNETKLISRKLFTINLPQAVLWITLHFADHNNGISRCKGERVGYKSQQWKEKNMIILCSTDIPRPINYAWINGKMVDICLQRGRKEKFKDFARISTSARSD